MLKEIINTIMNFNNQIVSFFGGPEKTIAIMAIVYNLCVGIGFLFLYKTGLLQELEILFDTTLNRRSLRKDYKLAFGKKALKSKLRFAKDRHMSLDDTYEELRQELLYERRAQMLFDDACYKRLTIDERINLAKARDFYVKKHKAPTRSFRTWALREYPTLDR